MGVHKSLKECCNAEYVDEYVWEEWNTGEPCGGEVL